MLHQQCEDGGGLNRRREQGHMQIESQMRDRRESPSRSLLAIAWLSDLLCRSAQREHGHGSHGNVRLIGVGTRAQQTLDDRKKRILVLHCDVESGAT